MTRGLLILVCAATVLGTALLLAGEHWASFLLVFLAEAPLALFWVGAAALLGDLLLSAIRLREPPAPALRWATAAALGLGVWSIAALLLGLAGWLNRWSAGAMMLAGPAAWACLRALCGAGFSLHTHGRLKPALQLHCWLSAPAGWAWLWAAAMPALAVACVGAALPPGLLWRPEDPHPYDVLEYHLQVPREWYEAGRITPLEHNVFSHFPMNVEMQYLLAMHVRGGPWAGMYLAQYVNVMLAVLAVAAAYAVVKDRRGNGHLAALAAISAPWLTLLAPVAYNEAGLLLFGTLAVGWMLRATDWRSAAAAGAMAGLACGTKYTAVPLLLVGLPVAWVAASAIRRGRTAGETGPAVGPAVPAVFVLVSIVVFLPWLVRNWAWTGNPVFPEATSVLGQGQFTDAQVERWTAAHSPRPDQRGVGQRLLAAWRQILIDWRYGLVLLPLALLAAYKSMALCGAGFGLHPAGSVQAEACTTMVRDALLLLLLLLWMLLFWLLFTHLQGRFFVLAIPIAAMLIGLADWGLLRETIAGCVIAAAVVATALAGRQLAPWRSEPVFGLENLSLLLPDGTQEAMASGANIDLIGDAQAFLYTIPMTRLRYRTVFDVNVPPGASVVDAWLGPAADGGQRLRLVDTDELRRFSRTYRHIPPPP